MNLKKNMIWIWIACLASAGLANAADYSIDPTHTSVGFNIRHMVSKVNGTFKDFSGTISFDPKKTADTAAEFTVKTASVDTQNEKRDKHLQSEDFFDAEKYPTMTFKSKKTVSAGKNKYKVTGDFTMHGVTREETFLVEFGGLVKDPWGNMRAGFSATTKLSRKAYGIVWNKTLDAGSLMLGDDVAVSLELEAVQKAAADANNPSKKM